MATKRVALYGGSFDPPHMGHVMVMTAILNAGLVDEIWLVPAGWRQDKTYHATPEDREAMIAMMLATMFGSRVPAFLNRAQLRQPKRASTTVALLTELERAHPDVTFTCVIGSDLVPEIPTWSTAESLMARPGLFLMVPRLGDTIPQELPPYITPVPVREGALTNISSSFVRTMIANGRSLDGVVPPAVISHIIRNQLYQQAPVPIDPHQPRTIHEGRFVRLRLQDGWEYVERPNCTGVVIIVATTDTRMLLLTEQYRIPVGKPVIEFPAGLVGDEASDGEESVVAAAARELEEETGYVAEHMQPLLRGPTSSGLTSELVSVVRATGLRKVAEGGGDANERIQVHEVPLDEIDAWLAAQERRGALVDPKVYAGLYWLQHAPLADVAPTGNV